MNLKLSILLVAVLLIVGGVFLALRNGTDPVPEPRLWFYQMQVDSLAQVSVTHQGQTVEYSKKAGTFDWYIQGPGGTLVFQGLWGGKPLLLSGPKVSRVISDNLVDPGNFGLDPPQTSVMVTDKSGNVIEFHLGNLTPDTQDQYARLVGDDGLFTLTRDWGKVVNLLATDPPFLRLFQIDEGRMEYIAVSDEGQTITYIWMPQIGEWVIGASGGNPVSQQDWGDTATMLSGPLVDERIALDIIEPAKIGLEPPETRVLVGITNIPPIEFHIGNITEDRRHRYARVLGETELYLMPIDRAQRIIDLVANPPS